MGIQNYIGILEGCFPKSPKIILEINNQIKEMKK